MPEPAEGHSTARLLTMNWLDGVPLMAFIEGCDDVEQRNQVALNMFRAWYVPFYGYGIIHGDPHLGNYTIQDGRTGGGASGGENRGKVNLLDFGCIRVFPPRFVTGVIDLYRALDTGDRDLAVHAYETWGFSDLSHELLEALNIWAEFLYAPLLEDKTQRIMQSDNAVYGAQVAGKVQKELRRLGGVKPPREFVLMDRAAIGLGSVFMHLKAEVNWHRLFHDLIEDFDEAALAERQQAALDLAGVPAAA